MYTLSDMHEHGYYHSFCRFYSIHGHIWFSVHALALQRQALRWLYRERSHATPQPGLWPRPGSGTEGGDSEDTGNTVERPCGKTEEEDRTAGEGEHPDAPAGHNCRRGDLKRQPAPGESAGAAAEGNRPAASMEPEETSGGGE